MASFVGAVKTSCTAYGSAIRVASVSTERAAVERAQRVSVICAIVEAYKMPERGTVGVSVMASFVVAVKTSCAAYGSAI